MPKNFDNVFVFTRSADGDYSIEFRFNIFFRYLAECSLYFSREYLLSVTITRRQLT
jgi:hypothetical protein